MNPSAVAIIPAHNEGSRIAAVIQPVLRSGRVTRVLVVNDGSTDDTAERARETGAFVLSLRPNRGKGSAMLAGLRATTEPIVLFLDADLIGLGSGPVARLVDAVASGQYVMATGLRDYGSWWNRLQVAMPRITGERAVLRSVLEHVPESYWSGFRIEAGINAVAATYGKTCDVMMWGVSIVPKWNKSDSADGFVRAARMAREVLIAMGEAQALVRRP